MTNSATRDTLAIRWFTPRGRMAREDLLHDIRADEGANLRDILAQVRRDGVGPGYLDLRGIDLRGEDLASARLLSVDFSGACLNGVNMAQASLQGSRFVGASLQGATLKGASMTRVDLTRADLTDADLSEAILDNSMIDGCRLIRTRMTRTRMYRVRLKKATIRDVDLSSIQREPQMPPTRRYRVTRPPDSEPRRRHSSRRFSRAGAHDEGPESQGSLGRTRGLDGKVHRMPGVTEARYQSFDDALAALMRMRDTASSIVVQVDGVDVVLYLDERSGRMRRAA